MMITSKQCISVVSSKIIKQQSGINSSISSYLINMRSSTFFFQQQQKQLSKQKFLASASLFSSFCSFSFLSSTRYTNSRFPSSSSPMTQKYFNGQRNVTMMISSRRFASSSSNENEDDDFSFDTTAAIAQDAENVSQQQKVNQLIQSILPPGSPQEAFERLNVHFTKEPINDCIQAERVVITHVANEAGEDTKLKMPEMSFEDALEQAKENNRDLQQVALNRGVAYCRLRDAKGKALDSVRDLIGGSAGGGAGSNNSSNPEGGDSSSSEVSEAEQNAAAKNFKKREMKTHTFRDVVNSHFCDWRGIKIANELARGHPIKLQILQFVSPDSASRKMQELMEKIEYYCHNDKNFEEGLKNEARPVVGNQSTGIHVSDKELAVTLQPTGPGGAFKHPSPSDWKAALKRHEQLCMKSGRKNVGTYAESKVLKPIKVAARTYRVDKYGRRLD